MNLQNVLSLLGVSVLITLVIALWVAPKLREAEGEPAAIEAEASPAPAAASASGGPPAHAAFIDQEDDGHYWTRADVNGTDIKFMVDTGASVVALTYRDAQRLGLKPERLEFKAEIRTAGGVIMGAPVTLDEIRIGRVKVADVQAMVLSSDLDQSLLGMSFLGELRSYEFSKGQLIIRQ